jgi:hypothetical protein
LWIQDSNQRGAEKRLSDWGGRFKFVMGSRKVAGDKKGIKWPAAVGQCIRKI